MDRSLGGASRRTKIEHTLLLCIRFLLQLLSCFLVIVSHVPRFQPIHFKSTASFGHSNSSVHHCHWHCAVFFHSFKAAFFSIRKCNPIHIFLCLPAVEPTKLLLRPLCLVFVEESKLLFRVLFMQYRHGQASLERVIDGLNQPLSFASRLCTINGYTTSNPEPGCSSTTSRHSLPPAFLLSCPPDLHTHQPTQVLSLQKHALSLVQKSAAWA